MKAKPFVFGLLAAMAGVAAVSIYMSATVDKIDKAVAAVASPDGRYKAVRITLARGGAAPFCVDSISIFLSVYPDNFAENDKTYEVYARSCAISGTGPVSSRRSCSRCCFCSSLEQDFRAASMWRIVNCHLERNWIFRPLSSLEC